MRKEGGREEGEEEEKERVRGREKEGEEEREGGRKREGEGEREEVGGTYVSGNVYLRLLLFFCILEILDGLR